MYSIPHSYIAKSFLQIKISTFKKSREKTMVKLRIHNPALEKITQRVEANILLSFALYSLCQGP